MSMSLGKVFEPFVEHRLLGVMARGVLEPLFHAERIDALCARTAAVQYPREWLLSSVVALMGQGVLGLQPSVHAAYQAQADQRGVSDQAVYDTLPHVEWCVSAARVREAARQAAPGIGALQAALPPLVPGDRTKILDGTPLAASDHRLAAWRRTWAAPVPGQTLGVWEPQPMLATEGVLCADGQAQDRSLLGQGLPLVDKDALWLAERTCCPVDCLGSMAARGGHVVRRQHRQRQGPVVGARPCQGALDTGAVYEQQRRLVNGQGDTVTRRRLTSAWPEPTRDGAPEVHGLSHVPERQARAHKLAERDGKRWTMETMCHELTDTLPCEVKAWASPQAAVFGLCLALLADNAVSVLQAALRAIHGRETVQQDVSAYSLSLEISQTPDGRMVAIPSPHWTLFRTLGAKQLADVLKALAENVHLRRDKKHPRGPKKQPTKRTAYKNGGHVSTAKVLALRI